MPVTSIRLPLGLLAPSSEAQDRTLLARVTAGLASAQRYSGLAPSMSPISACSLLRPGPPCIAMLKRFRYRLSIAVEPPHTRAHLLALSTRLQHRHWLITLAATILIRWAVLLWANAAEVLRSRHGAEHIHHNPSVILPSLRYPPTNVRNPRRNESSHLHIKHINRDSQ